MDVSSYKSTIDYHNIEDMDDLQRATYKDRMETELVLEMAKKEGRYVRSLATMDELEVPEEPATCYTCGYTFIRRRAPPPKRKSIFREPCAYPELLPDAPSPVRLEELVDVPEGASFFTYPPYDDGSSTSSSQAGCEDDYPPPYDPSENPQRSQVCDYCTTRQVLSSMTDHARANLIKNLKREKKALGLGRRNNFSY